jgi:tRNA (cytidine/uridine-2'-O-)-methyltransferase
LHIVLIEPEIPGNTGNIARLCAATGMSLHLVRPLGFSTDDRHLRRAGLDYWHLVKVSYYDDFQEVLKKLAGHSFYFLSTKGVKNYAEVSYALDDVLVFGKESKGIPEPILKDHWEHTFRIPMIPDARSLNLANSVAIVSYEAMRQNGFPHLTAHGRGLSM